MSVATNLNKFMESNRYTKADIAKMSSIPYTTIDGLFKKSDENIKLPTLKKLANLIGCSLDELVYSEEDLSKIGNKFNKSELALIKKYRQLDADGKRNIDRQIDFELFRMNKDADEPEEKDEALG